MSEPSQEVETKPEPSTVNPVVALCRRLRKIQRFRRGSVLKRAARVEHLLTELLSDATRYAAASSANPCPASASLPQAPESASAVSREEHERLIALLDNTRQEYDDLISFMDSERAHAAHPSDTKSQPAWLNAQEWSGSTIPRPLSDDVTVLHGQIEFLESELEKVLLNAQKRHSEEKGLREQIEVLRTQLLESRHETIELRIQNAELSDQHQEKQTQLSWAERKEQLLSKLEAESSDDKSSHAELDRVQDLINQSQIEIQTRESIIADRDKEIEELKMLLTRQSTINGDLAVGAAAIAQVLDSDELIQCEREKLRILKEEWEAKLRNAEIEISMERAKIARERLEYEVASAHANSSNAQIDEQPEPTSSEQQAAEPAKRRTRRWLHRLGLRDEH